MQRYIIRRLVLNIFVIFLVLTVTFVAVRVDPNAVTNRLAHQRPGQDIEQVKEIVRRDLGLDEPVWEQYGDYLGRLVTRFDLGESVQSKRPVTEELKNRVGPSIELGLLQLIVALIVGLPVGAISAVRHGTWVDHALRLVTLGFLGMPVFVTVVFVSYGTTRFLDDTPIPDWFTPHVTWVDFFENPVENLKRVLGPALIGGLATGAVLARFLRTQMLEVLRQDYVRTAWSKGLRERAIVIRHALKNAMIPVLTIVGLLLGTVVAGDIVLEVFYHIPGIGLFAVEAMGRSDFPAIQGVVLLVTITLVFANLAVDLAYAWLDPRIHYS